MVSRGKSAERRISGILDVHVHKAEGLISLNSYGQQDVYARFLFGEPDPTYDAVLQTKTIKKGGSNPTFDQGLQIGVPCGEQNLKCEVFMAQSRGKDQLIGFTKIPLHPIISGSSHGRKTATFRLVRDYMETPAGNIVLTLVYHDIQSSRSSGSNHSTQSSSRRMIASSVTDNETRTSMTESVDHAPKNLFKRKSDTGIDNSQTGIDLEDHLSSTTVASEDQTFKLEHASNISGFPNVLFQFTKPDYLKSEVKKIEAIYTALNLDSYKEGNSVNLGLKLARDTEPYLDTQTKTAHAPESEPRKLSETSRNFILSLSHQDSEWVPPREKDCSQPPSQLMELFPLESCQSELAKSRSAEVDAWKDNAVTDGKGSEKHACDKDHLCLKMNVDTSSTASPTSPLLPLLTPQTSSTITFKPSSAFKPYSTFRNGMKGNDSLNNCSVDSSMQDSYPQASFISFLNEGVNHNTNTFNESRSSNCDVSSNYGLVSVALENETSPVKCNSTRVDYHPRKGFKRLKSLERNSVNLDLEDSSSESKHSESPANPPSPFPKSKSESYSNSEAILSRDPSYYARSSSFPLSHCLLPNHQGNYENSFAGKETCKKNPPFPFLFDQGSEENSSQSESSNLDQSKATAESHLHRIKEEYLFPLPEKREQENFDLEKIKEIKSRFDHLGISLSNLNNSSSSPSPDSSLLSNQNQHLFHSVKYLPDTHPDLIASLKELQKVGRGLNGHPKEKETRRSSSFNESRRSLEELFASLPPHLFKERSVKVDCDNAESKNDKSPLLSFSILNPSGYNLGQSDSTNYSDFFAQDGKILSNGDGTKVKDSQLWLPEEIKKHTMRNPMDESEEQRRKHWNLIFEKTKGRDKIFYGSRAFF